VQGEAAVDVDKRTLLPYLLGPVPPVDTSVMGAVSGDGEATPRIVLGRDSAAGLRPQSQPCKMRLSASSVHSACEVAVACQMRARGSGALFSSCCASGS
jgi:hypothetical protein